MRTGIIRCASSRACADALSCSNSRLFAVRQFDRPIVLMTVNCELQLITVLSTFHGVKLRVDPVTEKMLFTEQRFKARIANCSGVGTNVIRQVSEVILQVSPKERPRVTEANFLMIREVTFFTT